MLSLAKIGVPAISASWILIHLIGAVCLLLWGTGMVRTGFTRAYGTALRRGIALGTGNRIKAFFSGLLVTGFLQSSTATTLIVSSFTQKGFINTAAGLSVIIGADISTTLVAQLLSFDLSWVSPTLLAGGIILQKMYERSGRIRHLAKAAIGIGLMMLALTLIRESAEPLKHSEILPLLLKPLAGEPSMAIVFAAIFTWVLHSSLAAVLLFAAMAGSQILPLELTLYLVLGANIGGALVPLAATLKDGAKVRRITAGNVFMRLVTLAICFPFLGMAHDMLAAGHLDTARQVVTFHTGFNILLALIFMPMTGLMSRIMEKILPDLPAEIDEATPVYLDEASLQAPVIALAGAARETLRLADMVEKMLRKTITAFERDDYDFVQSIREMDNNVDKLYRAIKLYLTRLSLESFDPKEADRYLQILTFSTNLEYCGDVIDKNLMDLAEKRIRQHENFSEKGFAEIKAFHAQILENLKLAQTIFLSEDPDLAAQLVEAKKTVRWAEVESSRQHFLRLRERLPETVATSSLHLDIIRDLRRINSYITSVAHAILDHQDEHAHKRKQKPEKP